MKIIVRSFASAALLLLLEVGASNAQEVVFQAGPTINVLLPGLNGGFAWGDVNGDGSLDVFIPANNIFLNNITTFTPAVSTMTANVPFNTNATGVLLADFNGDQVIDLFTTNGNNPASGLFYDSAGVFKPAAGTGDLKTAGSMMNDFGGASVADIDHGNYLSLAWAGAGPGLSSGGNYATRPGGGIWLLKGGASGFTNIGDRSTFPARAIDTSLTYEAWNPMFLDANDDGYPDLLMPSFRNGFSRVDTGTSGSRKGTVLFLNDKTGKFFVPTGATLGRTIYAIDSIGVSGTIYAGTGADTGIIVDDTVRHFEAICNTYGDFNNDGIEDLVLSSNNANNMDGNGAFKNLVILYGKGDGTFTYKYNGATVVANNNLPQIGSIRGTDAGDYNNDTWLDLVATDAFGTAHIYRNNGDGTFSEETAADNAGGTGSRAIGFVDFNRDGFLDLFSYTAGNAWLLKNNGNTNKWIGFKPIGTGNNKSAIGAVFTLYTGGTKQIREIRADAASEGVAGEVWAHFGIGTAARVDSLQVAWPDGQKQTFVMSAANNTVPVDAYYTIQEGQIIPSAPVVVRPSWAAHDTSLTSSDTLSWTAAATGTGITTYQVQIAAALSFSAIVRTVSAIADTSTIVRLGLSTKYYWRVKAFDGQLPGPWSAIDSFRTLPMSPLSVPPNTLLPISNSKTVSSRPTLVASSVPVVSMYHFQVRSDSSAGFYNTSGFVLNDSTFDTTYTFTTSLTPSKTYYWHVRGFNPSGSTLFSSVDSFTIMFVPETPVKVYPTPNQANVRVNPLTLRWKHEDGDSNFVIQLWRYTSDGSQILTTDTTKHDTSWTINSDLLNRANYYWKVQCFNQGGASAYTAVDSFTTIIEVPPPPGPDFPVGISTPVSRRPVFAWSPALNAQWYHLQMATGADFSGDIVVDTTMIPDTTMQIADTLACNTVYYWRVSAINLGGEGAFSKTVVFRTYCYRGVHQFGTEVPREFSLFQNYPNPFNPSTTIRYGLPKNSFVKIIIYDVLGRQVAKLVDERQAAGYYEVTVNAGDLSSGVYFYRITAGTFTAVKKFMVLK